MNPLALNDFFQHRRPVMTWVAGREQGHLEGTFGSKNAPVLRIPSISVEISGFYQVLVQ